MSILVLFYTDGVGKLPSDVFYHYVTPIESHSFRNFGVKKTLIPSESNSSDLLSLLMVPFRFSFQRYTLLLFDSDGIAFQIHMSILVLFYTDGVGKLPSDVFYHYVTPIESHSFRNFGVKKTLIPSESNSSDLLSLLMVPFRFSFQRYTLLLFDSDGIAFQIHMSILVLFYTDGVGKLPSDVFYHYVTPIESHSFRDFGVKKR